MNMNDEKRKNAVRLKLHFLSEGISFSDRFINQFSKADRFMEKRKVYNNSDEQYTQAISRAPQELLMEDIISAVNYKRNSPWMLDFSDELGYHIQKDGRHIIDVTFPKRPCFLERELSDGVSCGYIANLYGGMYLAFFTPAYCHYNSLDMGCHYCSLKNSRRKGDAYAMWIDKKMLCETTRIALREDAEQIKGIMLVGGNLPCEDENFQTFLDLSAAIEAEEIAIMGRSMLEIHIATMPPRNLELIKDAGKYNIRLSMNLEVYDDQLFEQYCPGKAVLYGREHLKKAILRAAEVLPYGRAHSILIAGLEPVESTISGIMFLAENGVVPIVNVFHNDYGTILQHHKRPSVDELLAIGQALQEVYKKYSFTPYWNGCGRNSIDYEAKEMLFV